MMAATAPPRKKRRRSGDTDEHYKEISGDRILDPIATSSLMDILLDTTVDDIFDDTETNTDKLQEFSKKLELIQKAIKLRIMNSISLNKFVPEERRDELVKFVHCMKAAVDTKDTEGYGCTNHSVTTIGQFKIGPNKKQLKFNCNLYSMGYNNVSGTVSFGDIWNVQFNENEPDVTINLDEIKKLVKDSGIKGIGMKSIENNNNNNNNNNDSKEDEEYYGYYQFTYDLSKVCINIIEERSDEGCWYGNIGDLNIWKLWDRLKSGDQEDII